MKKDKQKKPIPKISPYELAKRCISVFEANDCRQWKINSYPTFSVLWIENKGTNFIDDRCEKPNHWRMYRDSDIAKLLKIALAIDEKMCSTIQETETKDTVNNDLCKGCGRVWYNCLCSHEEE